MVYVNARFLTQEMTGVQRYAMEISKQLRRMLPDIRFLSPGNIIHREVALALGAETHGRLSGQLWEQVELPAYLKKRGSPPLLNLANTAPLLYRNQLTTIHDLSFLRNPAWFRRSFSRYYRFLIPRVARRSLRIITVSEFSKGEISSLLHVPEDKISVIPNAASEAFSAGDAGSKEYGDYILTVSSLNPRKNLRRLIEAYKASGMGNIRLVIVGKDSGAFNDEGLEELIRSSGCIHIERADDETMLSLYRNARLMVYPSLYEGFGVPPLEAMACGCPVVVSNAASLPEACGDAAYYVDPYSVQSIADGMLKVLKDDPLRRGLIEKGIERAKTFSWERSAREYLKVIDEVLASSGRK